MFANKKEFFEFIESKCKTNYDYRVLRNSLKNIDVEDIKGNIINKIEFFIEMNEKMIYAANNKMNELYKEIDVNEKAFSEYGKLDSIRKNFLNENQLLEQLIPFLKIKKEDNEFNKYINLGNQDIETKIENKPNYEIASQMIYDKCKKHKMDFGKIDSGDINLYIVEILKSEKIKIVRKTFTRYLCNYIKEKDSELCPFTWETIYKA